MDYYKILGVSMTSSKEEIHKAFRELSRKHHPDRFPESDRAAAEQRYQNIVKAFNTLKDPGLREKYGQAQSTSRKMGRTPASNKESVSSQSGATKANNDTEDPKVLAKRYYETGLKRVEAKQIEPAIECFKRSIFYFPTAEAHFQKGLAELKDKRFHREAVQSLQDAIKQAPNRVEYRLQLAKAFEEFGMKTRASNIIESALKTFPGNQKLMAFDEKLNPEKYKKGGLGGLFGNILGKK